MIKFGLSQSRAELGASLDTPTIDTALMRGMGQHFKAVGSLTFESKADYKEVTELLGSTDVLRNVKRNSSWTKNRLELRFGSDVSHADAFLFQDWLQSIAEIATDGALDLWQEGVDTETRYTRLRAGGEIQELEGVYPHRT